MRIPPGSIVTACALSVALLLAGCARPGVKETRLGVEIYLQPATSQGPEPFTDSTVTDAAVWQPPGPGGTGPDATAPTVAASARPPMPAVLAVVPPRAMRALSGGTPGLYSGVAHVSGCDVERQIGYLTADRARGDAFARAAGVSATGLPGYLRGLTPVVLRADTRVTDHTYHDRRAAAYQAVLQAGTAVLVDNRGVPRVRCACGNPLGPPAAVPGGLGASGSTWSGYRPSLVVAVIPAPRAVTSITIVDVGTHTWIERRTGPDVRHDRAVPAPAGATPPEDVPDPANTVLTGTAPAYTAPAGPRPGTATPFAPATPGRTPAPTARPTPAAGLALPQAPPSLGLTLDAPDGPGPPAGPGPRYDPGPPGGFADASGG
ncbi:DUF6777 domain-containing protein [Streptomyces sp. FXJ1.172]|uniref:DUF6777 domain-containing protein n=1 Tax=Streptomyces sp. FXJ1.172 TaxID=710705 RepID=UPI0007CF51ED|nr:DUF6777 domain-containing protein [Streptomyces sp. FXJ1.172]WEO93955.1 hypothetical protein A6P39_007965 [Streptomyces sp. FXJ1.172]